MTSSRRDFLKSAGAAGVGLSFGGLSPFANRLSAQERHLLPPDILPVVFLSGSDYEMGYQYGQQAAAHIHLNAVGSWASALQRLSHDEVRNGLRANQYLIEQHTPEIIEMVKGMSAGATAAGYDVSYEDALMMNTVLPDPTTAHFPSGAEGTDLPPRKSCSVCSA